MVTENFSVDVQLEIADIDIPEERIENLADEYFELYDEHTRADYDEEHLRGFLKERLRLETERVVQKEAENGDILMYVDVGVEVDADGE